MKWLIFTPLLLLFSCQMPALTHGDCRPSAEIRRNESEKKIEITFHESLSEVVNGVENCDFAFRPIKVDNAQAGGNDLEVIDRNGTYVYRTDYTFDMDKPVLSFRWDGREYISDPDSIENRDGYVRIGMRKFPPK